MGRVEGILLIVQRTLRAIGRSLLFLGLLVAAAVDFRVRRPRSTEEGALRMHLLCRRVTRLLGFECDVQGQMPSGGAVVSNHLSYMDILLFAAAQPFVMVAKTEVRAWPLLGWLTAQAGTVYVKRGGGPPTWPGVNAAMAEAYRSGLPVLFFPEGTTTDGASVLPFRRGLFHSVLNHRVPLRVAAVSYSLGSHGINGEATLANDVCWWGDMEFGPHMFRLLGLKGMRARIRFGGDVVERADRFVLSEMAQARIVGMYEGLREAGVEDRVCEGELVEVS